MDDGDVLWREGANRRVSNIYGFMDAYSREHWVFEILQGARHPAHREIIKHVNNTVRRGHVLAFRDQGLQRGIEAIWEKAQNRGSNDGCQGLT